MSTHMEALVRSQAWIEANTLPNDTEAEMVWIDVETTDLDQNTGYLLELGLFVTDRHGFLVKNGVFQQVISHKGEIAWDNINPFVRDMHTNNRLIEEVEAVHTKLNAQYEVEGKAVTFLQEHFGEDMAKLKLPLAGSSVDFDKRWIERHMPLLREQFGYRIIDNSSTKEQVKKLNPEVAAGVDAVFIGGNHHRVITCLIDTINEYRYYIAEFFWTTENAQGFALEVQDGKRVISTSDAVLAAALDEELHHMIAEGDEA